MIDIRSYGALVNGIADDQPAVMAAAIDAASLGAPLYFPSGTTLLAKPASGQIVLTGLTKDFAIVGDPGAIIKRGDGVCTADNQPMFQLRNLAGAKISAAVRGVKLDANARGNPLPVGADPVAWQHSHSVQVWPTDTRGFSAVTFDTVEGIDGLADHFNVSGNAIQTVGQIRATNVFCSGRARTRFDITITASWDEFIATGCIVDSLHTEPNSLDPGATFRTILSAVVARQELALGANGAFAQGIRPWLTANGIVADGTVTLSDFDAHLTAIDWRLKAPLRFVRGRWQVDGGSIRATGGAGWTSPYAAYYASNGTQPEKVTIRGVEFSSDADVTALQYHFNDNNSFGLNQEPTEFIDCAFRGASIKSASVRSGRFRFAGCSHESANAAILQQSVTGAYPANRTVLMGNVSAGQLYQAPTGGNPVTQVIIGNSP